MKTVPVDIYYKSRLAKWFFPNSIAGFTLGRSIYFKNKKTMVSVRLRLHELIHVCQYEDMGKFKFLWIYFIKEFSKKYRSKTFEKQAYSNELNPQYIEQQWPQYKLEVKEHV